MKVKITTNTNPVSKNKNQFIKVSDDYLFNVDDSSLSRIMTHSENGLMLISAFVNGRPDEVNLANSKYLEQDIRSKGLGFITQMGGWKDPSTPDADPEIGEISYAVPYRPDVMTEDEFYNFALHLAQKYDQKDVMLIMPSVNSGKPSYLSPSGNIDMEFKPGIHPYNNEEYFSKLSKGDKRAYVFRADDTLTIDMLQSKYRGKRCGSNVADTVVLHKINKEI